MPARRIAADTTQFLRRRHSHASEKGAKRNDNSWKHGRSHSFLVEWDDLCRCSGFAVFGNKSAAAVVPIIELEVDGEDLRLECVTRFRAFDINRTGQDVAAGSAPVSCDFIHDRFQ